MPPLHIFDHDTVLDGSPGQARQWPSLTTNYSAAWVRAPRTPRDNADTRSATALTVRAVGLPVGSSEPRTSSTSAEPTTTPSAPRAIAAACSAVRTPTAR